MARGRKSKITSSGFKEAVRLASQIVKKEGLPHQTHCRIQNGWLMATDGVVSIGYRVEEEFELCPQVEKLHAALSRCDDGYAMTQLENGKLVIQSGKFRALINCIPDEDMLASTQPDEQVGCITPDLMTGLDTVRVLAKESGQHVVECCVLIQAGSVIATDNAMLMEYWHGSNMPNGLLVPRIALDKLFLVGQAPTHFGYSSSSLTFHFAGGNWLKTQLYAEEYPDVSVVLNQEKSLWPVPEQFFAALPVLDPFTVGKEIYFGEGKLQTAPSEEEGASFAVEGIQAGTVVNARYLRMLDGKVDKMDFYNNPSLIFFAQGNLRGAIAKKVK